MRACAALLVAVVLAGCTSGDTGVDATVPPPTTSPPPTILPSPTLSPSPAPDSVAALWASPDPLLLVHDGLAYLLRSRHVETRSVPCGPDCDVAPAPGVAVAGGRLFVETEDGVGVFRFPCRPDTACRLLGQISLGPLGHVANVPILSLSPPSSYMAAVAGGRLYVVASLSLGGPPESDPGRLFAFDASCHLRCEPLWRGPLFAGATSPAPHEDEVYVPSSSGLWVFSGCVEDGSACAPLWTAPMNTGRGIMDMAPPLFQGDMVVELTAGYVGGGESDLPELAAYPQDCRRDGHACAPLWSWKMAASRFAWGPLIVGAHVVVAGGRGKTAGYAIPLSCERPCRPTARFEVKGDFFRSPVLAGDRVVFGSYRPARVSLFDPSCVTGTCTPAGTWRTAGAMGPGPVVLASSSHVLVGVGADAFALSLRDPTHGWRPDWRWEGRGRIEKLTVAGRVLLVGTHRGTYAVALPRRLWPS